MPRFPGYAALAIALVMASLTSAHAEDVSEKRMISVSGTGIVNARPDTARVSIGVLSEAATAKEALDTNTAAMSRVIVELKGKQVEPKDIQTTSFSVNPRYEHFKDGRPPVITGYRVVNAASIIVRDLANLGTILDQTVSQGSNQINGIQFTVENADEFENEARKRAMKDARQKAELYAGAANVKLGKVLTISEGSVSHPQPVFRRAAMQAQSAPVPIEAGEQQISAQVQVSWEIGG